MLTGEGRGGVVTSSRRLKKIEDLEPVRFKCADCGEMRIFRWTGGPEDYPICADCHEKRRPEPDENLQCELCKEYIQIGHYYRAGDEQISATICQPCVVHLTLMHSTRREE